MKLRKITTMLFWALSLWRSTMPCPAQEQATSAEKRTVVVVAGAPGLAEYADEFNYAVTNWMNAARQAGARFISIGFPASVQSEPPATPPGGPAPEADRLRLEQTLGAEPREGGELWVVLVGHGTYDGRQAQFNLNGPDVASVELAE